jgi:Na+-transporting NADH:ubiquinone oxidoreductase subunit NqrF
MSEALKNQTGNGAGKIYFVGPNGQLVAVREIDIQKHKAKAGWRLATQGDVDTSLKLEADRKAAEAKANAPAHVERVREVAAKVTAEAKQHKD